MKKILVLFCAFINIAFMQEECSDFLTQDECLSYDFCEWVSGSPNGMNGMCVEFNNDGDDDWSCSDINNLYECYAMDCEWISGDMPGAGLCVEGDDEEDKINRDVMAWRKLRAARKKKK